MCHNLRKRVPATPRILLTAAQHVSRVYGAANTVLAPPFTTRKLRNRVHNLLPPELGKWREIGPTRFNQSHRWVVCNGRDTRLTKIGARLLMVFLDDPNTMLSRAYLMKHVWETDYIGDTRTLDVHISWLRRAIEADPRQPQLLQTVRGSGYVLQIESI